MEIGKLTKKKLKQYQELLDLLTFFGVSEDDLKSLSTMKSRIDTLEQEVEDLHIEKRNIEKVKESKTFKPSYIEVDEGFFFGKKLS